MPYLRPDRTGLPDPPSEDGDNASEMPRSESYLRLSDLAPTPSVSSHAADSTQPDPQVQLKISRTVLRETAKVAVPTPPAVDEQGTRRSRAARAARDDGNRRSMSARDVSGGDVMGDSGFQRRDGSPSRKSYHSPQDSEYPDYTVRPSTNKINVRAMKRRLLLLSLNDWRNMLLKDNVQKNHQHRKFLLRCSQNHLPDLPNLPHRFQKSLDQSPLQHLPSRPSLRQNHPPHLPNRILHPPNSHPRPSVLQKLPLTRLSQKIDQWNSNVNPPRNNPWSSKVSQSNNPLRSKVRQKATLIRLSRQAQIHRPNTVRRRTRSW